MSLSKKKNSLAKTKKLIANHSFLGTDDNDPDEMPKHGTLYNVNSSFAVGTMIRLPNVQELSKTQQKDLPSDYESILSMHSGFLGRIVSKQKKKIEIEREDGGITFPVSVELLRFVMPYKVNSEYSIEKVHDQEEEDEEEEEAMHKYIQHAFATTKPDKDATKAMILDSSRIPDSGLYAGPPNYNIGIFLRIPHHSEVSAAEAKFIQQELKDEGQHYFQRAAIIGEIVKSNEENVVISCYGLPTISREDTLFNRNIEYSLEILKLMYPCTINPKFTKGQELFVYNHESLEGYTEFAFANASAPPISFAKRMREKEKAFFTASRRKLK